VQDAVASVPAYLDILSMFGALIPLSGIRQNAWFESLQHSGTTALRPYCPTQWVLRESALTSVLNNYEERWLFLEEVSSTDTSEAAGFANQLSKFQTFFHLASLNKLFGYSSPWSP